MSWLDDLLDAIFKKKELVTPAVVPVALPSPVPVTLPPVLPKPVLTVVPPAPDLIATIDGKNIYKSAGIVYWKSGMAVDADGCPTAYHPSNTGLDYLANAGKPGDWYGVICDSKGEPVVQGQNDPAPGYYISPTALTDKNKKVTDPTCYVDSQHVPYIAVPPQLKAQGVKLGDLCVVEHKGSKCTGIVADIGPRTKIGEASMAMAFALGIKNSPKNGGLEESAVTYYVFCGTTKGWPRDADDIRVQAMSLYSAKTVKI